MKARERYIEEALEKAVIDLCGSTAFEKLRVKEICERAGVSKQAFYNHFRDKYEVVAHIFEKDIQNGMGEVYSYGLLVGDLQRIWDRRDFYRRVLMTDGQNSLQRHIRRLCIENNTQAIERHQGHALTAEQSYMLSYQSYGFIGCLLEWVKGELVLSVEELARAEYHTFPAIVTDTWMKEEM